jgi:adenylate cyclase
VRKTVLWAAAIGGLVIGVSLAGPLEVPDLHALNSLFVLRGPRPPAAPIVIVTIDEDSFADLDLAWPWPRALHGRLLDILGRGPVAVGFDIVFAEPSSRGPADDRAFAAAIARAGNVVLAAAPTEAQSDVAATQSLNAALPVLRAGAAAVGVVNYVFDVDSNVRRSDLTEFRFGGEAFHSFVWHLYQLGARAGIPARPLPATGSFLINYRGGARTFPQVPYYRVLNGEFRPEEFAGKIVLVGATTPILHDVFSTPFAPPNGMPGVEIHANALDTLFRGDPIRAVPRPVEAAIVAGIALLAVWLTRALRPLRAFFVLAGGWLAAAVISVVLFVAWQVWLGISAVTLSFVLGYGVTVVVEFLQEQREKRRLSRFFSPSVLAEIVRHKTDLALGSSRRLLTVLFSDIRGFTSISEQLPPELVVELLGEYLSELTEIVFRHGGTVDKYVGDCIMALYNVPFEQPDHARQAVRTALAFQESTRALSARWEARLGIQVKSGVGINTGEAVVGTMGSRQRLEYTAIGDTVNLAARLESITKDFDSPIVISESTYLLIKDAFPTRPLGEVTVKGKAIPVRIYAVLPPSAAGPGERRPAGVAVGDRKS